MTFAGAEREGGLVSVEPWVPVPPRGSIPGQVREKDQKEQRGTNNRRRGWGGAVEREVRAKRG